MRVFVTGADGFIGSHLVQELLSRGHDVTALSQYNSFNSHGWLGFIPEKLSARVTIISGTFVMQASSEIHSLITNGWRTWRR